MCNHYTNQFATYNNNQDSIGYEVYDPLEYGEEVIITAPIPTYQDYIERLGDYVINSLEQPLDKDICWVKDVELTRRNVLHLIETVDVRKKQWVLLAGRVSLHEEHKHDTRWRDSYDIWCCSSEEETINDDGNARYLTIELEEYFGELKAYPENEDKPWLCKKIKNISGQSDIFEETSLVLPPAEIIKYFVFAERYIPETGYADETSLHFEIVDGCIIKEIQNYGGREKNECANNSLCVNCPHINIRQMRQNESSEVDMEWLRNMLKEYGVDDE